MDTNHNSKGSGPSDRVSLEYKKLDFKYLPKCLHNAYNAENRSKDYYLFKLLPAISHYPKYIETFKQITTRDCCISDVYDLYAYMTLNSNIQFQLPKIEEECVKLSMDLLRDSEHTAFETICDELFEDYRAGINNYFYDFKAIQEHIVEQCLEPLAAIKEFYNKHKAKMEESFPLMNEELVFREARLKFIYGSLSIPDQYELTRWPCRVDLTYKPISYLLVIRLLFGESLPRELYFRHPHLIGIKGDIDTIIKLITKKYPEDSRDLRLSVTAFASLSGIDECLLASKCLRSI